MPRRSIVIVGNGMVSYALCSKLVKQGFFDRYDVTVIGEEPRPAYDRVNLTKFFCGKTADDLQLATKEWYEQNRISLTTGERVDRIDREEYLLVTSSGVKIPYDYLILATGSRPFVPPIEGAEQDGVFVYRTIEDLQQIRDYSKNVKSAAVMGGGLLGLEAAKALYDLGHETHVIEMAPALMSRQLDAEGASILQNQIEELGVHVHLTKRTQSIESVGSKKHLHFDRGPALEVDMVVISTGIRPRDELARESGLQVGPRGGIAINDELETSDPSIFAIGECALHRSTIYGLVVPGNQMADVLADNLMGQSKTFERGDQSARLKLLGVDVATLGEPIGEVPNAITMTWQSDTTFRKLIMREGRVVGTMSVGSWPEIDRVRQAVAAGRRLWSWNLSRFRGNGTLWPSDVSGGVVDWPESATVCSCLQINRGVLCEAKRQGYRTVEALAAKTGASTVCGSCQPLLAELAGTPNRTVPRGWKSLLVASVIALCVLSAWLFGPVPFAETVAGVMHRIDFFWRDSFWKQVTGYTLLGVSAGGLLLSARKRLSWINFGSFGFWRTAHAVIGILTLGGLIAHTGMHLGSNLNFTLGLTFLSLNLVGAITGAVTAWESRVSGPTALLLRRWRPRITQLHVWLLWPLPVLLVFHIACVYYY